MSESHAGSCLCGAVRFNVDGPLRGILYCHCSQCRKQTGHFYAATSVSEADLTVSGDEHISWYNASEMARRGFCRNCGSALFWQENSSTEISVLAGAFERPSGLKGEAHIFAADKGEYYSINDGLPVYPGSSR
ncbi:GFA family protein [Mesorhizobium sp. NBSH29]|uniref:GFA family protein n=1 Tax=Mesorhizobium sp. NBSH29 TaxID=2654249 RepID=UPI001896685A|nr:GFA family protein [Mesorhizobium sp. NBSH29]QPC87973.1 GFA family protein [Mesorhizobium sp. NBSH29]